MKTNLIFGLVLLKMLTGCSLVTKVAVDTTGQITGKAAYEMETESSWETFASATPANLKFVEGLLFVEPKNENLLLASLKGRAGYAFGVLETRWLHEKLSGNEDESIKLEALKYYSKAISYGDRLFLEKGLNPKNFSSVLTEDNGKSKFFSMLDNALGKDELELAFYYAQALGGLINLNRTSPILLAKLPVVKNMFDWLCEKSPNFQHGACGLFYGTYEAGRPKLLGGSLEKGKKIYLDTIKNNPENHLAKVTYLIYYVIPTFDKKEFRKQKEDLAETFEEWEKGLLYSPIKENKAMNSPLNLFNAIARKQFDIIVQNEKEIF